MAVEISTHGSEVVIMDDRDLQRRKLVAAEEECNRQIDKWSAQRTSGHCESIWDGVLCWGESSPDTLHTQSCPNYIHGFNTKENASRYCDVNGSWFVHPKINSTWTDYMSCIDGAKELESYHYERRDKLILITHIGYGISLVSLVLAVVIICCSRKLKSKTNVLHLNLFLAFILRACISLLIRLLFVNQLGLEKDLVKSDTREGYTFKEEGSHWECRLMQTIFMYSICVSQMWIFMEGLYLHMLIYKTISTDRKGIKFYIILGWVLPLYIVGPWVIVKYTTDNTYCWNFASRQNYIWIINGPILATVLVNFIFFLNISRVLFIRVRSGERHMGGAYRRLAKFILVLVPLFGVFYIVLNLVFPLAYTTRFHSLQMYVELTYNAFQGFLLALLFCFLNEEVLNAVKGLWRRRASKRDSGATRSFVLSSIRRASRQSARISTTTNRYCSRSSVAAEHFQEGWFSRLKRTVLTWIGAKKSSDHSAASVSSNSSRTRNGVDIVNHNKIYYDDEETLKCISSFGEETSQIT